MNYSNIIQGAVALLVFVAALAAVIAYLRTNISKNTVELYRLDNEALRGRIKTLEDDATRAAAEVRNLRATVDALHETVTQAVAINRIERFLAWQAKRDGYDYPAL